MNISTDGSVVSEFSYGNLSRLIVIREQENGLERVMC